VPEAERFEGGNGARPGIVARLDKLISAAADLLSTRSQIFGDELSRKGAHLARGIAAATIAATLAFLAFLLLAGLVAAFFARILGSAWLGVLVALVLYAGGAALAAFFAIRAFGRVKPLDFPITSREIGRDWEAVRRAAGIEPEPAGAPRLPEPPTAPSEGFEERLREGWE